MKMSLPGKIGGLKSQPYLGGQRKRYRHIAGDDFKAQDPLRAAGALYLGMPRSFM